MDTDHIQKFHMNVIRLPTDDAGEKKMHRMNYIYLFIKLNR